MIFIMIITVSVMCIVMDYSFQLCAPTASYFFEYYMSFSPVKDHVDIRYDRLFLALCAP